MNRADLEHILRAAAAICNEREFIVIGSQAILGQYPDAPLSLLVSIEADVYPRHAPVLIDVQARRVAPPAGAASALTSTARRAGWLMRPWGDCR